MVYDSGCKSYSQSNEDIFRVRSHLFIPGKLALLNPTQIAEAECFFFRIVILPQQFVCAFCRGLNLCPLNHNCMCVCDLPALPNGLLWKIYGASVSRDWDDGDHGAAKVLYLAWIVRLSLLNFREPCDEVGSLYRKEFNKTQ